VAWSLGFRAGGSKLPQYKGASKLAHSKGALLKCGSLPGVSPVSDAKIGDRLQIAQQNTNLFPL